MRFENSEFPLDILVIPSNVPMYWKSPDLGLRQYIDRILLHSCRFLMNILDSACRDKC